MTSEENVQVYFGEEAVQRLDLETLNRLAHDSELSYTKRPEELPGLLAKWHQRIHSVLDPLQIAAVTVGDPQEVVSIAGFWLIGKTDDGRPVFEAGRSVTLNDHRHRGYYKMAMDRVMEEIRRQYPEAVIIRCTTQEAVKANAMHSGFVQIDSQTYARYRANLSGERVLPSKKENSDVYQFFALDLAQQK